MIEIKVLRAGDEFVLQKVAPEVFDEPIDARLTHEFLADPRHHIVVAIENGVVVGMATGVHYVHPDKARELWINEVGVAPTHLRRGIGKKVLLALLDVGRSIGCREAWLATDLSNTAARALYSAVKGREVHEQVMIEFDLDLDPE